MNEEIERLAEVRKLRDAVNSAQRLIDKLTNSNGRASDGIASAENLDLSSEQIAEQIAGKRNGQQPNDTKRRFELIDASQLKLNKSSAYLVKHLIPAQGLIVVWGPPKCGKSFWILDVIFHIALNWVYRGRRVKQGLAVYVGCEGAFAVPARVEAFRQWKIRGPIDPEKFKLVLTRLDLVSEADQLISDIEAQLGDRTPAIIVIDTLNRSLAGSESSDEDMGNYVKAADKLRERFGCAIAIVHHCGINDTRPRGHTSLAGAADAQIAVKKENGGLIVTEVEFMKDGPEGEQTFSRFKVITNLDYDEDGEPISSCVLDEADGNATSIKNVKSPKPRKLPAYAQVVLDALRKAMDRDSRDAPANNGDITSPNVVNVELWRAVYYQMSPINDADPAEKRGRQQDFRRAQKTLQQAGLAGIWGEWAWLQKTER